MAIKNLDAYSVQPQFKVGLDSDSETAYHLAHGAGSGDGCNTGGQKFVGQSYTSPGSDHRFDIRRLPIYFFIDVPTGSTINSATLSLSLAALTDPPDDFDWILSIRKNDSLSDPVVPGECPVTDFPVCLGGTQIASKYVNDILLYGNYETHEFVLPDVIEEEWGEEPIVVPQTYLKLALVSRKDLAGVAPDDTQNTMFERVQVYNIELIIDFTLPTTEVTTNPATLVSVFSATLNGTLTYDGGEASDCSFEWGLTNDYGETTTPVSKVTGETFSAGITELLPGTTYHFRAKAVNSLGTFYGADRTFGSSGSAYPSVSTTRVSSLVHRWTPGSFTLEMVLGGITSEFDLIIPTGKPTPTIPMVPTVPTLPSCQSDEKLTWSLERGYYCMKISDIPPGRF